MLVDVLDTESTPKKNLMQPTITYRALGQAAAHYLASLDDQLRVFVISHGTPLAMLWCDRRTQVTLPTECQRVVRHAAVRLYENLKETVPCSAKHVVLAVLDLDHDLVSRQNSGDSNDILMRWAAEAVVATKRSVVVNVHGCKHQLSL